jgi:LPXTG-site transpeptidase (sortase) family protein
MKSFDTIYKAEKKYPSASVRVAKRNRKTSFYYLYRSFQIVLTVWIVTILAITTTPWLDYWVKTALNHKNSTQVLGDQAPANISSPSPVATSGEATFYLKNDKITIEAPIIEGIGEDSLSKGIGHHPDSVWPNNKGNVVLAGHNTDLDADNPYARVFFKLRDVSIGDQVVLNYQGKNYYYIVDKSQTVKPTDTTFFQNTDEWMLTFYTCDPPYTDWKRLVFQAKLEKIE